MRAIRGVDIRLATNSHAETDVLNIAALTANGLAILVTIAVVVVLLQQVSGPLQRLDRLSKEVEDGNVWARYGEKYPHGLVGTLA